MMSKKINLSGYKKLDIKLMLSLVLAVVLLFELFFIYTKLFQKLNPEPDLVIPSNIVRVDLKAYNETLQFLQNQENYSPQALQLKVSNPFR